MQTANSRELPVVPRSAGDRYDVAVSKRDAIPMLTARPTSPWKLFLPLGASVFFIIEGVLQVRHHQAEPGILHLIWGVLFIPLNVKVWLSSRHHVRLNTHPSFLPFEHRDQSPKSDRGTNADQSSIDVSDSGSPKKFYSFLLRNRWYNVNDDSTPVIPVKEMLAAAVWIVMISAGFAIVCLNVILNESLTSGGLQYLAALFLLAGVGLADVVLSIGMTNNIRRKVKERRRGSH